MAANKKAEFLVIGGGLAGLTMAAALSKANRHVVLLEATENFGGQARAAMTPLGRFEYGFKTLPYLPVTPESLAIFETILGVPLHPEILTRPMLTYQKQHFMPFVGFGSEMPQGYEGLRYYLNPKVAACQLGPAEWIERLNQIYSGTRLSKACVTKIEVDQVGKTKQIRRVEVNGQDQWEAHHVIYCAPLRDLPPLIGAENFGAKQAQKVASTTYWTAVSLDLVSKRPLESLRDEGGEEKALPDLNSLFVLSGGTQPFQAQIGQFLSPQHSQWLTFVPFEVVQNDESSAAALKEMKRQIGRAFGKDFMADINYERIVVSPGSHGEVSLKLGECQQLGDIKNLSLISSYLKAPYNLIGLGLQIGEVLEGLVSQGSDLSVAPPA